MSNPAYINPVLFPGATITSGIGQRTAPTAGASTNHRGVDIGAPLGTSIIAPVDLNIDFVGQAKGYGNTIYGTDPSGNQFRFAHLDDFAVAQGAQIAQGTLLGTVGMTGTATGPNLHLEVRDAAGNLLSDVTNKVAGSKVAGNIVSGAKGLLNKGLEVAGTAFPPLGIANNVLGIGDSCGIICQIQKWIMETDIFKRTAFVFIGALFIGGAIIFFSKGNAQKIISEVAK